MTPKHSELRWCRWLAFHDRGGDMVFDGVWVADDAWAYWLGYNLSQAGALHYAALSMQYKVYEAEQQKAYKKGFNAGYVQGVSDSPC
jgi:hypothetical protein